MEPADQGKWLLPSVWNSWGYILSTISSFGLPSTRKTLACWSKFSAGLPRRLEARAHGVWGEAEGTRGFGLEERWVRRGLCLKQVVGEYREDKARLFSEVHCSRMRGHRHKLGCGKFWPDVRKTLFSMSLVKHWNRSHWEAVEFPSLDILKTWLYKVLNNLIWLDLLWPVVGLGDLQMSLSTKVFHRITEW